MTNINLRQTTNLSLKSSVESVTYSKTKPFSFLLFLLKLFSSGLISEKIIIFGPSLSALLVNLIFFYKYTVYYSGIDWKKSGRLWSLFEKVSTNSTTRIVCTGTHLKDKFTNYGNKFVELVKPPLKTQCKDPKKIKILSEKKQFNILSVGAFSKRKNQILLLKVAPILIKRFPNILIRFCGFGNLNEFRTNNSQIIKSVEKNIIFEGHVASNDVLSNFYNSADILVITSKEEGVPRALYESISYGTPVISTALPGVKGFFGDFGIYVDFDNENDLAEQIIRLLTSRRDYDAMSRKVKQLYLNFFEETTKEMFVRVLNV